MANPKIGIWLIGIKGGVACTAIVGLAALKKNLINSAGLVSQLPQFQHIGLLDWDQFIVAGHEIRRSTLADEVLRLAAENRIVTEKLIEQCRPELEEIEQRIRPGTIFNVGPTISALADADIPGRETPRETILRLRRDMADFVRDKGLEHLVVVNLASTEPPVATESLPATWTELDQLLDDSQKCPLRASSLYAIAALGEGHSFINFTPSLGSGLSAIDELARRSNTRHYGCDGKTGETLLKSVLAPMFARRNLSVLSWVGHNIFGNMDGQVLNDPTNKASKKISKDHLLGEILGYRPNTVVSIEYLPDLGDWKTAWDHIHFSGFLGVPMTLQFIWQASDSILAAPLVLDMIRFTELARRRGHVGHMTFLASFFKSPYGVSEHRFEQQFQMLEKWVNERMKDENKRL
jgi:myo-inositol-1-phosphate synthase